MEPDEQGRAAPERRRVLALAGAVTHDLANPLSVIRANVTALEQRLAAIAAPDPEAEEALADVRHAADRLRVIVEDLRAFSRDDEGPAERCALGSVVEEAGRALAVRVPGAVVRAELPEGLPPVVADRRRLVQALLWVLATRGPASQPGEPPRLRVVGARDGDAVVLAVEVDPASSATSPAEGSGLAAALAREALAAEGGLLETSEPEGLRVVLPAAAGDAASS